MYEGLTMVASQIKVVQGCELWFLTMCHRLMCYFDGQWFDEVNDYSQVCRSILHHVDETWHHKNDIKHHH
jgi:hypothetical protein